MRTLKERIEVVDDRVAAILRSKSGAERLAMVGDAWNSFRRMMAARLKDEHPDWTEDEVRKEIFRRLSLSGSD